MSVYDAVRSKVGSAQQSRSSILKSMVMPAAPQEGDAGGTPAANRFAGMTLPQLRAVDVSKLSQQEHDQWSAALREKSEPAGVADQPVPVTGGV